MASKGKSRYLSIPRALPATMVAGALGATLAGGAAVARAAEPTTADLQSQLQQLQEKVRDLEASRQNTATTQAQQAQAPAIQQQEQKDGTSATIGSVLNDAERRSQFMQLDNWTAGHEGGDDGHFEIRSSDGNFTLVPSVLFQFRSVLNFRSEVPPSLDDEWQWGFEIARAKLELAGHVFSPKWTYDIRWASGENNRTRAESSSQLILENAYVQYQCQPAWAFRGGQWKDNVFHEENVYAGHLLAVDRSLVNEIIGGGNTDYVQGVAAIYDKGGPFRAEVSLHDGAGSRNTDFTDVNTNFGFSGRAEYALMGDYTGYDTMSARRNDGANRHDMLVLGGGADWTQAGDTNVIFHTIDAQWEPGGIRGLAAYGAFLGRFVQNGQAADGSADDFYDIGFVVQGAYMLNNRWEVFGRYSFTELDSDEVAAGQENNFNEITIGLNYYLHGQSAKFTIDASWLPNGCPSDIASVDYLASTDDEFVVRAQFQLLL
jgi:hypothetical protein